MVLPLHLALESFLDRPLFLYLHLILLQLVVQSFDLSAGAHGGASMHVVVVAAEGFAFGLIRKESFLYLELNFQLS